MRWPLLVLAAAIGAYGQAETDIWGHLRFGLDILHARALPHLDPYAFTTHGLWVNHEWGSDVLFGLAYTALGLPGLAIVRLFCAAVTLVVLNRMLRSLEWPSPDVAILAVAIASMPLTLAVRPHDFSLPLYTLTLYLLIDAHRQRWLPAIFAIWANLHGGWLMGYAAVVVYIACYPSPRHVALGAMCLVATLVNPFGIHLWFALIDAMRRGWSNVTEWQPAWIAAGPPGHQPLVFWIATATAAAYLLWKRRPDRFAWAWTAAVALISLKVQRHGPFFTIAVVALLLPSTRRHETRNPRTATLVRNRFPARLGAASGLALAGAVALAVLWPTITCLPTRESLPPVRPESAATEFFRSAGLSGRLLTWFDWGEYTIWQLSDRVKVSIDNRRETVYDDETISRHVDFYYGRRPSYPDEIGADYVWLLRTLPAVDQLRARGWFVLFDGPHSIVLGRSPRPPVVARASAAPPCFPNP